MSLTSLSTKVLLAQMAEDLLRVFFGMLLQNRF
jgi:hypothetical protein